MRTVVRDTHVDHVVVAALRSFHRVPTTNYTRLVHACLHSIRCRSMLEWVACTTHIDHECSASPFRIFILKDALRTTSISLSLSLSLESLLTFLLSMSILSSSCLLRLLRLFLVLTIAVVSTQKSCISDTIIVLLTYLLT